MRLEMISQDYLKETEKIESKLKLDSPERIEEALQYCATHYRNEENRRDKIESKANTLIAASTITIGFITGFLCMILYDAPSLSLLFLIIILIVYIIIAMFIIKSINYSLKIGRLVKDTLTDQQRIDYNISETDLIHIKKARVINYYLLFTINRENNDKNEKYINIAQNSMKNAVIVLLLLSLSFVLDIVLSSKINLKYLNKIRELIQRG